MNLKNYIRSIPDYPKKGILFRDITTLIKDEKAFAECIDQIIEKSKSETDVFFQDSDPPKASASWNPLLENQGQVQKKYQNM